MLVIGKAKKIREIPLAIGAEFLSLMIEFTSAKIFRNWRKYWEIGHPNTTFTDISFL